MANELSQEILNRVRVWEESIRKSYEYLLSIEKFENISTSEENYFHYVCGSRTANFHIALTKNSALLDASIIHFMSVFLSGYSGNLMAGNQLKEIDSIRKIIVSECLKKIEWEYEDFTHLFNKLKTQRDSLFAHYDGRIGDYKKISEGLYSRKMSGIQMFPEEIEKFRVFLKAFLEIIFEKAYG